MCQNIEKKIKIKKERKKEKKRKGKFRKRGRGCALPTFLPKNELWRKYSKARMSI